MSKQNEPYSFLSQIIKDDIVRFEKLSKTLLYDHLMIFSLQLFFAFFILFYEFKLISFNKALSLSLVAMVSASINYQYRIAYIKFNFEISNLPEYSFFKINTKISTELFYFTLFVVFLYFYSFNVNTTAFLIGLSMPLFLLSNNLACLFFSQHYIKKAHQAYKEKRNE